MDSRQISQVHLEEAVNAVISNIQKSERRTLLQVAAGTGVHLVVRKVIFYLFELYNESNILVLTQRNDLIDQIKDSLDHNFFLDASYDSIRKTITFNTYSDFSSEEFRIKYPQKFFVIICIDAEFALLGNSTFDTASYLIGITSRSSIDRGLFKDTWPSYRYTIENAIKDGTSSPQLRPQYYGLAIEGFCERLLKHLIGKLSKSISDNSMTDFEFEYNQAKYIVEVKSYRSRYAPIQALESAIKRLNSIVDNQANSKGLLITLSEVPDEFKQQVLSDYQIAIWDIANVLYYSMSDAELLKDLHLLTYFSISDIVPTKPFGLHPRYNVSSVNIDRGMDESIVLKQRLNKCKYGKQFSTEYENICFDIITYLFPHEFFIISNQHRTNDSLFRMDLICSLKGESAFWNFLVRHFNTRYVVFEFKNYSDSLDQNLIFITEKYLFNAALRNVAIMISRKGFSKNATSASLGCLKESGKLIIDLTDADLETMLAKKAEGADPSDYLLEKLDHLLMSISK